MKVIAKGSARVDCNQCGSALEYEWNDIKEYGDETVILCPICGKMIEVPSTIRSTSYATLVDTNSLTIKPQSGYPYDIFIRDSIYASNSTIDGSVAAVSALSATDAAIAALETKI